MSRVPALLAAVALVVLTGCGDATQEDGDVGASPSSSAAPAPDTGPSTPATPPEGGSTVGTQPGRLADLPDATAPTPTRLVVGELGIDAPVVSVGVEPDGDMEVPAATDVGWYRFGPVPGGPGSAVLAAHVDFDGRRGVFFELSSIRPGAIVEVASDDGSTARYVVESVTQVAKGDLAATDVFDRAGEPRLALITCGGAFDGDARSYRDNIVVTAVPEG